MFLDDMSGVSIRSPVAGGDPLIGDRFPPAGTAVGVSIRSPVAGGDPLPARSRRPCFAGPFQSAPPSPGETHPRRQEPERELERPVSIRSPVAGGDPHRDERPGRARGPEVAIRSHVPTPSLRPVSIRSPVAGGDPRHAARGDSSMSAFMFQSAPPSPGETHVGDAVRLVDVEVVSIRSPVAGGDPLLRGRDERGEDRVFQSAPPSPGETHSTTSARPRSRWPSFNPLPRRRGRPTRRGRRRDRGAPRRRFNPLPRRRGRPTPDSIVSPDGSRSFQSAPPSPGETHGATRRQLHRRPVQRLVSIRSPVAGGDPPRNDEDCADRAPGFNPLPRRRGRPTPYPVHQVGLVVTFQSAPPSPGETHSCAGSTRATRSRFNPLPRRRGRPTSRRWLPVSASKSFQSAPPSPGETHSSTAPTSPGSRTFQSAPPSPGETHHGRRPRGTRGRHHVSIRSPVAGGDPLGGGRGLEQDRRVSIRSPVAGGDPHGRRPPSWTPPAPSFNPLPRRRGRPTSSGAPT